MTVGEKLDRTRRRVGLLGAVGGLLLLVAVVAGPDPEAALMLAVAGSIVIFVAVYQICSMIRCPRCGESLGPTLAWPPGRWSAGSRRARHCPFCGVNFDEELRGT